MKVSREKEGGKTNIVCVYIYGFPYGRGGKGQNEKKSSLPPLLDLLYIALLYALMDLHFSW